jgi:hypothetical protein
MVAIFNKDLIMYGFCSDRVGPMETEVKPLRAHITRQRSRGLQDHLEVLALNRYSCSYLHILRQHIYIVDIENV